MYLYIIYYTYIHIIHTCIYHDLIYIYVYLYICGHRQPRLSIDRLYLSEICLNLPCFFMDYHGNINGPFLDNPSSASKAIAASSGRLSGTTLHPVIELGYFNRLTMST